MDEQTVRNSVEAKFDELYKKFRIALYRHIFSIMGKREGSLSATDFFSVETIFLLGNPTITEFAEMLNISAPNASYRVKSLIEKGYVTKYGAERKNTFRLAVTEKFMRFYHENINYGRFMLNHFSSGLGKEELAVTDGVLGKMLGQIDGGKED